MIIFTVVKSLAPAIGRTTHDRKLIALSPEYLNCTIPVSVKKLS